MREARTLPCPRRSGRSSRPRPRPTSQPWWARLSSAAYSPGKTTTSPEALVAELIVRDTIYIDGAWVPSDGPTDGSAATIDVENPATEEVIGRIPSGTASDVDRAVKAARAAQDGWQATSPEERGKLIARLQEAVTGKHGEIAKAITLEMGAPAKFAELVQAGLPIADIATAAQLATSFEW